MQAVSKPAGVPPYAGLKVVEIAEDVGGEYLGRLLAEMGAEVIKVEPPEGAASRRIGPYARGEEGPETSLHFWYYNSNKRSVVIELETDAEGRLAPLLADADILIISAQPARLAALGLDLAAISDRYPRLIIASVTPFGLTGPYADYKSSNLVGLAAGGPLMSCGYDDHSISPINPGGDQAYHTVAAFAHIGVLLALLHRQETGRGQVLDVSMHGANAVNVELANPYWFYPGVRVHRQTCRHAQPSPTQNALFQCADGRYVYYTLILSDTKTFNSFVGWMEEKGMAGDLTAPEYQDVHYRQANFHQIQSLVECFFLCHDSHEMYHGGQQRGLPVGLLNAPEDLFEDEHLAARGFFVKVDMGEGIGEVLYPGPGYLFSAFGAVPRTRAPHLGEHDAPVRPRAVATAD